jgi:phosphoenolpyruvate carboxykinase (GTP)
LYAKQFSLYIDPIVARIQMQAAAYGKEERIPPRLFDILETQKQGLLDLKSRFGAVVKPEQLMGLA